MRRVTAAVILKGGKVLLAKRRRGDDMGGLWEFPGGEVEEGEGEVQCLMREMEEELGVKCRVSEKLGEFVSPPGDVCISAYFVELTGDEIRRREHEEVKWVDVEGLRSYPMPEADRNIAECLQRMRKWRGR